MRLSTRLIDAMIASNLTQVAIADRIGVTAPQLSAWKHGADVNAGDPRAHALAALLGVPAASAFDDTVTEMLTLNVPSPLIDNVEFYAKQRGLSKDQAVIRALRGFVASSIVREREQESA